MLIHLLTTIYKYMYLAYVKQLKSRIKRNELMKNSSHQKLYNVFQFSSNNTFIIS